MKPLDRDGSGGGLGVVIAASAFANPAGTESYILTVARELQRLGHQPVVTADELGPMAEFAERNGISVARSADELPAMCDAVLANDAITAAALAERYPDTRVVQFIHSDVHDHQLPVLLDGAVDAVIVASDRIAARVRALPLDVELVRLTHPIDTERFDSPGAIRERPRRALILSNYLNGPRLRALIDAWEADGVECVHVGAPAQASLDVLPAMAGADIVVAKGRAALEGMSCARAVYVYDTYAGDGWVTPERYAAFEADNFAGFATGSPKTGADLAADLGGYSAEMGWVNRELVRAHHGARRHAISLVEVLRGPEPVAPRPVTALAEVARLTRLNWNAERRTMVLQAETQSLRERMLEAEADAHAQADIARAKLAEADAWRARALEAERQGEESRALLATRRARAGLALGHAIDRVRRRR